MTRLVVCLLALCAFANVFAFPKKGESYNIYETPEAIIANGYPAERHTVVTDDGYILELHRIPAGKGQDESGKRPVVFLMHGLLSASNGFIFLGPEYGVAYNYADAGFDVWMGNARGNRLSRKHVSLDPDDEKEKRAFFNFSFEEIGTYDLAASVDYILKLTGQAGLHYVGHSQGGTVFLVLNSLRPEYNNKFKSAHLMAAIGYQKYMPDETLRRLSYLTDIIYGMAVGIGMVELFPPNSTDAMGKAADISEANHPADYCAGDLHLKSICDMMGLKAFMNETEPGPAGAAIKQVAHFGQNIRDKEFVRYNHGAIQNLQIYGSIFPPRYNIGVISTNVTMHYTVADNLLDERDVLNMVADLPNAQARRVAKDDFLHGDFVGSVDAKEHVTDYIIHAMQVAEITG